MKTMRVLCAPLLIGILMFSTGCVSTFRDVKQLSSAPPPSERPTALAVGEIKVADPRITNEEARMLIHSFQFGVEKWCVERKGFEFRKGAYATNAAGAILLSGTISEIEKGSAAARFWVGMGAGQQRVQGSFNVYGSDGTKLTGFSARKTYLGGAGIGGWDMMKVEDLMRQLGELVAETTDHWLRGEKIE